MAFCKFQNIEKYIAFKTRLIKCKNVLVNTEKKYFYINNFALSLAVKQRLMEQLWNYLFHLAQFFASFTKITGFFEALSTSPFTALNCSVNFWILLKFPIFFLICSFHKKHIFSSGLPYLPFYCVSVTQWIFQFFVIFAKFVCKTWTYLIRSFQCDPTAVNNIWDTPARKLAVWYSWCLVYPSKTKTQISRQ